MEFVVETPTGSSREFANDATLRFFITFILTLVILPIAIHVHRDYLEFIALGPGGTPSTVQGYLRVKALGLFALRNPYELGLGYGRRSDGKGFLGKLPQRRRQRPETRGIAPQRQVTQQASKQMYDKLAAAVEALASNNTGLTIATSCFEKHSTGLFSACPAKKTCHGEICHAHPSDGSMHLTLHPADADIVLATGWGERHPLARGGWFERFVPAGFLMIYAPLDEEELAVVIKVVQAAVGYICADPAEGQQASTANAWLDEGVFCRRDTSGFAEATQKIGPEIEIMKPWVSNKEWI